MGTPPTPPTRLRGADLLVPRGSHAKARAALVEAWGEETVARHEPTG